MADIEVTYRGVPVPRGSFGDWDTWQTNELNAFKAGVDAALGVHKPRVFDFGDEIPADVTAVRISNPMDGTKPFAYRHATRPGYWVYDQENRSDLPAGWPNFYDEEYPLTEVIS